MSLPTTSEFELKTAGDFQELVDDIDSLMASPSGVEPEIVARLNTRYELAVKAINARLRECDALLKKGLRNEALERCEIEPKLLDLFLILDFPERDSWEDTARQCGHLVPDLLVGVATELNDAYATEKPLAELKYQVRLHALARSPLPIRIALMRKLAKQDKNSSIWDEDLKVFERARHNQLSSDVQGAIKMGNATMLADLYHELQSPDWATPPAGTLLKQVAEALSILQRRQAREQLSGLEPQLTAAYSAFDVPRGREVRESWQKVAALAALPDSDPLIQTAAPALQWLKDQDQQEREEQVYQSAIGALVQSFDDGDSRSVLEERYQAALTLERGIPDDLKERFDQRMREFDREKARSMQLKLVGAGLAVVLIVGAAVFLIANARFRSRLATEVTELEKQVVDVKELSTVEERLTKMEKEFPRMAATPEIRQIKEKLKVAQEEDEKRKDKFKELMASARKDGVDQPTLQSIAVAIDVLEKAWNIAQLSSEKSEVSDLSNLVGEKRAAVQQQIDKEFSGDYANLAQEFVQLKAAPTDKLDELELVRGKVATLMKRQGVAEQLIESKRSLIADIDQVISQERSLQSEAKIMVEMNTAIGDPTKYFNCIDRYINAQEFAGKVRHSDFVRARSTDAPLSNAFQQWSAFLEDLMHRGDLVPLKSGTASKIRTDAERLIKEFPGFAFVPQVQDIVAYLGKAASRENGSQSMEKLLVLKTFKVFSVRSEGKQYYIALEPPTKDATGSISIRYFLDTEFKNTKPIRLSVFEHDPKWRSPQNVFENEASELLSKLREKNGANWDETFIDLLEKLYNNSDMDEILKVQIISHTLRASADGSGFLINRLDKVKDEIGREKLNDAANWVNPDDPEVAQERLRARKLLNRLGGELRDMNPLRKEVRQIHEGFKNPTFDIRYTWSGWMHRTQDGTWTCSFKRSSPLAQNGDLFVLIKSSGGQISFEKIGRNQQGHPTLDSDTRELMEGRPVYEKTPGPQSSKTGVN